MTYRTLVAGALGLVLVVVWAAGLSYQWPGLDLLITLLGGAAPVYPIKAMSFWSLLHLAATFISLVPVLAASVAAMLGARRALRTLRMVVGVTAMFSAGTLVLYGSVVAVVLAGGGPVLRFAPRITAELVAAASALVLQTAMLVLLRHSSTSGGGDDPSTAKNNIQLPNQALQPTSRDTQLAGMRQPPLAARG